MRRVLKQVEGEPLWEQSPPPRPTLYLQRLKIHPGTKYQVGSLASRPTGLWTHYVSGKTFPCIGERFNCPYCGPLTSQRWTGYLPVKIPRSHLLWFVTLTDGCRDHCPELKDETIDLKGHILTVWREGQRSNSPLRVSVGDCDPKGSNCPEPDMRAFLCNLWGLSFVGACRQERTHG